MEVSVFVRHPNSLEYNKLGKKEFTVIPRSDEYISAEWEGERKYFQVLSIHHNVEGKAIELYALLSDPPWEVRKSRAIGFGGR